MTTIVTRAGKGSDLTNTEVDANFTNLQSSIDGHTAASSGAHASTAISFADATNVQGPNVHTAVVQVADNLNTHATSDTAAHGAWQVTYNAVHVDTALDDLYATKLELDASNNLGVNVGPITSTISHVFLPSGGALTSIATQLTMACNAYYNSAWKAGATGGASFYNQNGTTHIWSTAASVAANASYTTVERMRLDTSKLLLSVDLQFGGTGHIITGDFSNATKASRTLFQDITSGNGTSVGAIPNGSGASSNFTAFGGSDPDNTSAIQVAALEGGTNKAVINATKFGSGTARPLVFQNAGVDSGQFDTSGDLLLVNYLQMGSGAPKLKTKKLSGTTSNTQGNQTGIAHGLTSSKILGCIGRVNYTSGGYVWQGHQSSAGYQFDCYVDSTTAYQVNHGTNSSNILSKAFDIFLIYEE